MMTPEEMRIAIAEKCGIPLRVTRYRYYYRFKFSPSIIQSSGWITKEAAKFDAQSLQDAEVGPVEVYEKDNDLPDYPNDLNVMHEAILALDSIQVVLWAGELYGIARSNHEDKEVALLMSSAAQQAEAFCRVFWPEKFK